MALMCWCGLMACGSGHELSRPEVLDFFALTISRVMPKSYYQAWYETKVCAVCLQMSLRVSPDAFACV